VKPSLIELSRVSKAFEPQKPILHSIDVAFPSGQIIGLVGPDGAGKTTLMRLIAGLLCPSEGTITVLGKDTVREQTAIYPLMAYMPQRFGLYEDLTVMQNLSLYADLRSVPKPRQEVFERLLKFTGLDACTDRLAKNLSGGMKQKLGLACSLITKPKLLLLDEPSVGVDPLSRRELWELVSTLMDEDVSVIWSTAYLDEAEKCDTVLLLNEGKVLFYGPPSELTQKVEGRVFSVQLPEHVGRSHLFQNFNTPNIIDTVFQGQQMRILVKDKKIGVPKGKPVSARFEDAFVDILGGFKQSESELAKLFPVRNDATEFAVQADHLTKKFGTFTAVNDLSFHIKRGTIFGLLGPNGAGKTTTFRMICGLLSPTSGTVAIAGLDSQTASSIARAQIGYMAQKFSLYGHLTVRQNLEFFAGIYNLSGHEQKQAIENAIAVFALHTYLNTSADLLPLGFKRRLSLACATMHCPEVLFLDEPTSGVDPLARREFWHHINGLVEKGVTVMVTTHFMDEADYCDRVALIYDGKIIAEETPYTLKETIRSAQYPQPSLEDVFIHLIEQYASHTT